MKKIPILFLCLWCISAVKAQADPIPSLEVRVSELTQMVKELKGVVEQQQQEINALRQAKETPPPTTPTPQYVPEAPKPSGKFTPEIGAVADVATKLTSSKEDTDGNNRVSLREIELVLGSNVDPYSRLDSTIAFNEDNTAELEEAYLTRFGLPFDTTARIGRLKPKIGRVIAVHRDSLDTVDEPLVIQRYFGVEGMNKSGVDLTKLLDFPSPFVHSITVGILEGGTGEGGTVFGQTRKRPTLYGHLKNYLDITDITNLDLGLTYAAGHKDEEETFKVNVLGLDATLIHHLNANQDFKLQGEAFYLDRKDSFLDTEDPMTGSVIRNDVDGHLWGGYGLIDFRINSQWATGFRFDYVELVDNPLSNPHDADIGYVGYLTFYQSEFARWRLQFNHIDLANGKDDNQLWIQGTFAIGDHKHKLQ